MTVDLFQYGRALKCHESGSSNGFCGRNDDVAGAGGIEVQYSVPAAYLIEIRSLSGCFLCLLGPEQYSTTFSAARVLVLQFLTFSTSISNPLGTHLPAQEMSIIDYFQDTLSSIRCPST